MRKRLCMKIKASLLSIALILFSNLYAKKIVLTPTVGKELSTPDKEFIDDEVLIGVGVRAYLNKNYALDVKFATSDSNLMQDGGKSDLERGSLNLYYDLFADAKVSPYFFAGAGYEKLHRSYKNIKSQAFYQAGGGIRIDLSKSVELSTEAKYLKKSKSKTKEFIATMGIGVVFGNECEVNKLSTNDKKIACKTYQNLAKNTTQTPKPAIQPMENKKVFFSDEVSYATKTKQRVKTIKQKVPTGNYIQVASLSNKTNIKNTIHSLKSRGYRVKLLKHSNLTTILVGPYKKSSISKVYSKIKHRHRDAFYKKL